MARRFVVICMALFFAYSAQAQGFSLSGKVQDGETKTGIPGATVILKSKKDSSLRLNTLTDSAGHYLFQSLQRDSFNLTISSIGFETLRRTVRVDSTDVTLAVIALPRTSQELSGVVVSSKIPPAVQKGDTVQFNASQFKVNPDATAEDLARKMPGITVENGQVKANGENVQKVTIDGRELFGDDATAALRNLPAEIIDKIQVFDRLSDQAQFTGFDDGNTQKGINIITKANMRNGQFGRVYAGYGTDGRYQAGGNTTFLKNNRKISLVGNFNNTNQQNFSQQDLLGVTSSSQRGGSQRGGGGGGPRGGGGSQRGGQGGSSQGGNSAFGNNANFLVGQQNGINKTNALGINYSDNWGKKLTVTGSYFFNNTENTTNEIANTQYFASSYKNTIDTTAANSRNNNHRINLRMEYKIDSANQLIITPSLSFQDNNTVRSVNRSFFYNTPNPANLQQRNTGNNTNSTRTGNNLNNSVLFRHSFPKRGRTFSINLNTSYNQRTGETYVNTLQHSLYNTYFDDTASQRFTNQSNNGSQLSTNLAYTEPLGKASQLQFNYNPSVTKSNADQETYGMNPTDNKYSLFLDSLSNKFQNTTTAQNAGVSYRYGNRDRQLSFGVNYQHTNLNSDQTFPKTLTVNKSFNNILPNAMLRYKLSTRSSLRIFYRANVNQPSVTQLQGVVDPTNAPLYTVGNPDLNQQYTHILSTQYTFTNTQRGILLVGNVFMQKAQNYITNATFTPLYDSLVNGQKLEAGSQLNKPLNLDGYTSLRSFLTFAVPLKFIKSNINFNGGFTYSQLPGYSNYVQNQTKNYIYTMGSVISSNISPNVDFTLSYSANFNSVKNNLQAQLNNHYFQHVAGLQLNLLSKQGWFFQNDINNQFYSGLSQGFNQSYFLWNMSAGKKFLKDKKGELKLSVFDLLKQNRSIVRNVTENYIEDVQNQVLRQYFMLTFTYNLKNFGTAASRMMNNRGSSDGYQRF